MRPRDADPMRLHCERDDGSPRHLALAIELPLVITDVIAVLMAVRCPCGGALAVRAPTDAPLVLLPPPAPSDPEADALRVQIATMLRGRGAAVHTPVVMRDLSEWLGFPWWSAHTVVRVCTDSELGALQRLARTVGLTGEGHDAVAVAVLAEREACAKVADDEAASWRTFAGGVALRVARAIRARGGR